MLLLDSKFTADIYGSASAHSNNDLFISGVISKFINQLCHGFETYGSF